MHERSCLQTQFVLTTERTSHTIVELLPSFSVLLEGSLQEQTAHCDFQYTYCTAVRLRFALLALAKGATSTANDEQSQLEHPRHCVYGKEATADSLILNTRLVAGSIRKDMICTD